MSDLVKPSAEEAEILKHLVSAWNLFAKLPPSHPSHGQEFAQGIHAAQRILMSRVLKRANPEVWGNPHCDDENFIPTHIPSGPSNSGEQTSKVFQSLLLA